VLHVILLLRIALSFSRFSPTVLLLFLKFQLIFLQMSFAALTGLLIYTLIIKPKRYDTTFSHVLGFGIILPFWIACPVLIIPFFDIRNLIFKFMIGVIVPILSIFRSTEGELVMLGIQFGRTWRCTDHSFLPSFIPILLFLFFSDVRILPTAYYQVGTRLYVVLCFLDGVFSRQARQLYRTTLPKELETPLIFSFLSPGDWVSTVRHGSLSRFGSLWRSSCRPDGMVFSKSISVVAVVCQQCSLLW
jgi:hypothetical protein